MKNGTYTITIPKQKSGTKVIVKISKSGYVTSEKIITVLNSIILNRISVDKKVARPGEKVTITMDIRGTLNLDIEYIEVEMGGIKPHKIPVHEIVYNDKLKKYQFNIEIDGTMHNDRYNIFQIDIADKFGSRKVYSGDDKSIIDLSFADFKVISRINDYSDLL